VCTLSLWALLKGIVMALLRRGASVLALVMLTGLPVGAVASRALAAPEPEVIPNRWEVRSTFSPIRVVTVETPAGPTAYYYMTYTAQNNAGQDVLFAPTFDMVTDDGQVIRSGKGVNAEATKAVLAAANNAELQDQIAIIGPLLQGEENAKAGIAIWTAENLRPGEFTVYAAGFSGESVTVKPPTPKDAEGVVLRKTRSLTYKAIGDAANLKGGSIPVTEDRWVMR